VGVRCSGGVAAGDLIRNTDKDKKRVAHSVRWLIRGRYRRKSGRERGW